MSQRSKLDQVWKQTGVKPSELEIEELPFELQYLRGVFWDIWNSDGWSWVELYYYQLIHGMVFDESEIEMLRKAFSSCSKFIRDKLNKKSKPKNSPKPGTKG